MSTDVYIGLPIICVLITVITGVWFIAIARGMDNG